VSDDFCFGDHCITCSDEGVPMRVVRIDPSRGVALCESVDGRRSTVDVALVDPVDLGDSVLVHAGVALVKLEEAPA
jgi:hydrogenase assembly chaperone HypC/HupF